MIEREVAPAPRDTPLLRVRDLVKVYPTAAGGFTALKGVSFDVYRGEGIDSGLKSIALGLILQETSRTLTDDDADRVVNAVISRLAREFEARIRD